MVILNNSYQIQQLGQNVHHHMLAYLWIKSRQISLKVKNLNRWSGFDILMTHGKQELQRFLQERNKTHLNLKFTSKEKNSFMDLSVSLCIGKLYTDLHIKITDCHQYLEYTSFNQSTLRNPSF